MEEKESFVYYLDWAKELLNYPDDLRLKIDDAVKRYVLYGEEPTDRTVLYSMFGLMRRRIDKDNNRWNDIREKRATAGRKGGKQRIANQANASLVKHIKQVQANQAVNVNDNNISSNEDNVYNLVINMWNEICNTLPKVTKITNKRRKKIKQRLNEFSDDENKSIELARDLFQRVNASGYLCGKGGKGWRCSFDWLFGNEENYVKVLEGNYDDNPTLQQGSNVQLGRGEWVKNGVRYYGSGKEVPMSAPPRPDTGSYWSGETNSWISGV